MSATPSQPCRFYFGGKGHCHFGDACRYSHVLTAASLPATPSRPTPGSPSPAQSPRGGGGSWGGRGGRGGGAAGGAPRQVCNVFWSSGSCNRGFECTFKHERRPGAGTSVDAPAPAEEGDLDFFSVEGLAASVGSTREESYSLNPSEAHNHMKMFLAPNYAFGNASKVQGFVRILASVNDRNKTWTSDAAQGFLDMIVNGNAILRIGDVLRFENVSYRVGLGGGVLSFQKGYFPIFEFFASNLILKSTLHKNINHLYTVIENNYETIHAIIHANMTGMIQGRSWKDPTPTLPASLQNGLDGVVVFKTLSTVLLQYFNRFKGAVRNHPQIANLVLDLVSWFDTWASAVSAIPPSFDDVVAMQANTNVRQSIITQLRSEIERLKSIVERESTIANSLRREPAQAKLSPADRRQALISQLSQTYSPPGELREEGSRHDNDFADIASIRIAPTHEELLCPIPPHLPVFLPDAPHHLPLHSMERHDDILFRLLREEMIATMRGSINAINNDLTTMWSRERAARKKDKTLLEDLLKKGGGAYRTTGLNSVFFQVYTNAQFNPVKAERRDLTVGLVVDTPPGVAREESRSKRYEYWKHSKRLQGGSLVALLLVSTRSLRIYLGLLSTYNADIAESSKANPDRIQVRVSFFDAEVELMALRQEVISKADGSTFALLVDNSVMFESVRPFLERLQTMEPTEVPFNRYIAHGGTLEKVAIQPPRYATAPRFEFKLQCLAKQGKTIHALNVTEPDAVLRARRELRESSELDPSQADAVVDTLTREVSLMQGPPGTGKSFTGKEILRVLFASNIRPIVLIAYTNHALDHMLTSILDAGITQKLVRLGSRSSDERIAQYTLNNMEKVAGSSEMERQTRRQYAIMKRLEEDMLKIMESIQLPKISWYDVEKFLDIQYPDHVEAIRNPPYWVQELVQHTSAEENEHGGFITVNKKGKKEDDPFSRTVYGFWRNGVDIQWITPQVQVKVRNAETDLDLTTEPAVDQKVADFFKQLGFEEGQLPPVPGSTRGLDALLEDSHVWSMSLGERRCLAQQWERDLRLFAYNSNLQEYEKIRENYRDACKEYTDIQDEARRRLLSRTDLIGCTTTGAAKLISLLSIIAPRVLMVEEAGQVLEAHILTALVPSVHHLICIGDPQQLRPNLATYTLSMDSERGKELYKFDRSLMERLHDSGLPMSQINVQRRMRPTISHFIRKILYPELQDHQVVHEYPPVQGMQKDVYFLTHINPEGGVEDSVSKFNMYEVYMIRDLVLYFLRQGTYSAPGDIAVLCAYLGQLQKVRAALMDMKIAVSVDERDQEQLQRQGIAEEGEFEDVVVAKHIKLGTVDIFQGQEAKIVIVSLVRNSGTYETSGASIGFLKSSNRINVGLSRAKHGLYILGNASNLKKNPTWSTIIDEMEAHDQIGDGFPIICPRHPHEKQLVSNPGELERFSPAGGCLIPCGFRLACGHICPSVCHAAPDNHRSMKCYENCNRTPCPRAHPCAKRCHEDCGDCDFPMYDIVLPCGHVKNRIPCHMMEKLAEVHCDAVVVKSLPRCEHTAFLACSADPKLYQCPEPCGGAMQCCGRECKSSCDDCQRATLGALFSVRDELVIRRTGHRSHPCERTLYCEHRCGVDCSQDHECNTQCTQACRQRCAHYQCPQPCHVPCAPCMQPCEWRCPHFTCPVVCGSICSRLPCDEPCTMVLDCGHACPSVCGEPCWEQKCPACLPDEKKADIVDFIMQRTLNDLDPESADVSERIITLGCGHIFTVETLDGHCNMSAYYEVDAMGQYLAAKAPPINYQTPPTCPTCRGPITALRYGRVTKRATLDILEQNVASTMSHALQGASAAVEQLIGQVPATQDAAKALDAATLAPQELRDRALLAQGKATEPLACDVLTRGAMNTLHGLERSEAHAWGALVKDYLKAYKDAVAVAVTRGAHVQAYEAALVTLYRLEMGELVQNPPAGAAALEPLALRAVDRKIGQPPHKADTRYQIDAFLLSLEVRFMLASVARSRIEGIDAAPTDEGVVAHYRTWCAFVSFLYQSCIADAGKATLMAERSAASRQAARAFLYVLRATVEMFRYEILRDQRDFMAEGAWTQGNRKVLLKKIAAMAVELRNSVQARQAEYVRSRPSRSLTDLREERQWFEDNCSSKVDRWIEDLDNLANSVIRDVFYQPVSLQERENIVKAFGFSHRGHFYTCQNGHVFVITECGGAMESATCPECRAPIGGSNHSLHSSNTRATEFEDIARRSGSADSPWAWARGA